MKILVTGGSGFVGAAIIETLLENEFEVFALVNQNSKTISNCENDSRARVLYQTLKADITNIDSLNAIEIPKEIDAVIHCAGLAHQFKERDERDFWAVNVNGTENIARLAARLSAKRFLLISSVSVYGKTGESEKNGFQKPLTEEAACRPDGVYASTKYESEKIARRICVQNRIELTILRLATVIGENDRGNVYRLIETIAKKRFVWIGDGRNTKSLIYKGDVAEACLKALKNEKKTGVYNLTAEPLTMQEIVEEIEDRLGIKHSRIHLPPKLFAGLFSINRKFLKMKRLEKLAETVRKWLAEDVYSGDKFNRDFRFQTTTPIREAIGREVESYLKRQ